jgi:Uncharacterized protein conserved in bacteria
MNYQKKLDSLIDTFSSNKKPPSLLLHSCCGPCSSYVLEYLSSHFDITLFYYNPNIIPKDEYQKRLDAQKQLLKVLPTKNSVNLIEGKYEPEKFLSEVKGLENETEGKKRCSLCFNLRLNAAAQFAKKLGCEYFSTTLSVSPHKNADTLAEISSKLADEYEIKTLPADFKKRGGYQRSIQLAHVYDLYRQDYCGCPFSAKKNH